MKRQLLFVITLTLCAQLSAQPFNDNCVIAHRGAWKNTGLPENSLASFRAAAQMGCHGSECDVWLSSDDSLMIYHDAKRFGKYIEQTSYAELRATPLSNGEPMPTLREYIKVVKEQTATKLIIDIKTMHDNPRTIELAKATDRLVHEMGIAGMTEYLGGYLPMIEIMQQDSDVPIAYLGRYKSDLPECCPSSIRELGIKCLDYMDYQYKLHPEWMDEFKKMGMHLNVWTVDRPGDIYWAFDNGFDYITTNEPELILRMSAERKSVTDNYLPAWKEGWFDIHAIATGKGEATFVVLPDGTSMLIDAGDKRPTGVDPLPDGTQTPGEWIARYVKHFQSQLPTPDKVDYMWITHFHGDHTGKLSNAVPGPHGFKVNGVTEVADQIAFAKFIDRGWPDYNYPSAKYVRKTFGLVNDYKAMIKWQAEDHGAVAERFVVGSDRQFALTHNPGAYRKTFSIRNLAGNCRVWTGKGLNTRLQNEQDPEQFDENMFSCAVLFKYGKFSYYHGGDLSGGDHPVFKQKGRDFESAVADLCGRVTMLKPDHHGWKDSSNGYFLNVMRPELLVFPSASTGHPWPTTFNRIADHLVWPGERDYYITCDGPRQALGEEMWSLFKPFGHIVVRVYEGGTKYQVYVLDATTYDYHVKYQSGIKEL